MDMFSCIGKIPHWNNTELIRFFSEDCGLYQIEIKGGSAPQYAFIRIERKKIIHVASDKDFNNSLLDYIEKFKEDEELYLRLQKIWHLGLSTAIKKSLPILQIVSHRDATTPRFVFFKDNIVRVTKESLSLIAYKDWDGGYIWAEQIIPHNAPDISSYDILPNSFNDTSDAIYGDFSRFIKLVSGKNKKLAEGVIDARWYTSTHTILTKMIGYYADTNKTKDFCPIFILTDYNDSMIAGGRTGKSFICDALTNVRKGVKIDMKQFKSSDDKNLQLVQPDKDCVVSLEDIRSNENMELFYNLTAGDGQFRKMYGEQKAIPFTQTPKFVASANSFVGHNGGSSDMARRFDVALYPEFNLERTPYTIFGNMMLEEYWDKHPEEWNKFYLFVLHCLQSFITERPERFETDKLILKQIKLKSLSSNVRKEDMEAVADEVYHFVCSNIAKWVAEKNSLADCFGRDDWLSLWSENVPKEMANLRTINKVMKLYGEWFGYTFRDAGTNPNKYWFETNVSNKIPELSGLPDF